MLTQHRMVALALITSLAAAGCSDDDEPKKAVNNPCRSNIDCADNICHQGVCFSANPKGLGDTCGGPGECRSFSCVGGVCVAGAGGAGAPCLYDEACASKQCVSGVCAALPDAALPDAALPDAPLPDAPLPDAALPDAPLPDAALPDQLVPPDKGYCNCDDKLTCTYDTCVEGVCFNTLVNDACLINKVCYAKAQKNPQNDCESCDPASSTSAWTLIASGSCDDKNPCTKTDTCSNGTCKGTYYSCDDQKSCTTDTCDGKGGCSNVLASGNCLISGSCYADGKTHPTESCYVCDTTYSTSRWAPNKGGCVVTYIGTGVAKSTKGSPATAQLSAPYGIDVDKFGRIFWSQITGSYLDIRIRMLHLNATSTLAGPNCPSSYCGCGWDVVWGNLYQVGVTGMGDVYFPSCAKVVFKYSTAMKTKSTLTSSTPGYADGPVGSQAQVKDARGFAVDKATDDVYVADYGNHCIRKISGGQWTTVAGQCTYSGSNNGAALAAKFYKPIGLDFNGGKIYVAEYGYHRIRMVAAGQVTTLAGAGVNGYKDGAAASALFYYPRDVLGTASGDVYVADTYNHCIRKISGGQVTTLAGKCGTAGYTNGAAASARFKYPSGLALDLSGRLLVTDTNNHVIRMIQF